MLETEIIELKNLNNEHKKLKEDFNHRLCQFNKEIEQRKSESVENQIKCKVESVYNNVEEALNKLMIICKNLISAEKLNSLLNVDIPNYNKLEFINELRNNYKKAFESASKIKSVSSSIESNVEITKFINAYLIIKDIKNNIDTYLKSYVKEKDRIDCATDKLENDKNAYINEQNLRINKNEKEAELAIDNMEAKIDVLIKESNDAVFMRENPKLIDSYAENKVCLGFEETTNEKELYLSEYSKTISLPTCGTVKTIDFKNNKNIYIYYSEKDEDNDSLWENIKCLSINYILSYPGNHKQIMALHNKAIGSKFTDVFSCIKKSCIDKTLLFLKNDKGFSSTEGDIRGSLEELAKIIDKRRTLLSDSNEKNIYEYNEKHQNNIQPLILCYIKDILLNAENNLSSLLIFGSDVGVKFIFLNSAGTKILNEKYIKDAGIEISSLFSDEFFFTDGLLKEKSTEKNINCTKNLALLNDSYFQKMQREVEKNFYTQQELDIQKQNEEKRKEEEQKETDRINRKNINNASILFDKNIADICNIQINSEKYSEAIIDCGVFCSKKNISTLEKFNLNLQVLSNLCIEYEDSLKNDSFLWDNLQSIILRFLTCYPKSYKRVNAFDSAINSSFPNIIKQVSSIGKDNNIILSFEKGSNKNSFDIKSNLEEVASISKKRNEKFSRGIFSYNEEKFDKQPLILVVIKDINFDDIRYNDFLDSLDSFNKNGIYFIIANNTEIQQKHSKLVKEYNSKFAKILTYKKAENGGVFEDEENYYDFRLPKRLLETDPQNTTEDFFLDLSKVLPKVEELQLSTILHNQKNERLDDFSKVIKIPIGISNGNIIYVDFETNNSKAHGVLVGMTGTRKSTLLKSIVLGGSFNYSPKELQYWLFDFKNGDSFNNYKEFKNVKVLNINNDKAYAIELCNELKSETDRREKLIRGFGEIEDYNKKMLELNRKDDILPRLIVIIDEYSIIKDWSDCIESLEYIARLGRSGGISLILASQTKEYELSTVISQVANRFEFKTGGGVGKLINVGSSSYINFLNIPGNCIFSNEGEDSNNVMELCCASPYNEEQKLIDEINEKYSDFEKANPIILGELEPIKKSILDKDVFTLKENEYPQDRRVFFQLGETAFKSALNYKTDSDNPLLLLLGDSDRASNIEYSICRKLCSFSTKEPVCYYIDLDNRSKNNIIYKSNIDNTKIIISEKPNDIISILSTLYSVYNQRMDLNNNGQEVGCPIELIIHSADKLFSNKTFFDMKNNGTISNATVSETICKKFNNNLEQFEYYCKYPSEARKIPFDDFRDLFLFLIKNNEIKREEIPHELIDYIESNGKSSMSISEIKDDTNVLTVKEMLSCLMANGNEANIYIILQFSNKGLRWWEEYKDFSEDNKVEIKDAVIIPANNKDISCDEEKRNLGNWLTKFDNEDVADVAKDYNNENDFNQMILIDELIPHKFLPIEWQIEEDKLND